MNLIEICRKLVSIDSSASHGTRDIVGVIAEISRQLGLAVEIQHENFNGVENANVLLSSQKSVADKKVILISRLDTREPGEYGHWVRTGANPFNASLDGGDIYGLGIAETKADFICKMLALAELRNREFKDVAPIVVGTFGLSSGAGAIKLIRKKKFNAFAAVVGAPTTLRLAQKAPGYARVEIGIPFSESEMKYHQKHNLMEGSVSQNKIFSRNPSRPGAMDFFDNPILKLIDYLKNLPDGLSIISVEGGSSSETDPDTAYLELDIVDNIQKGVMAKLIRIGESLKRLSAELKSVHDEDCNPPFSTITLGMARTYPEEIKFSGVCRLIPVKGRDTYESWLEGLRHDCAEVGANFRILDYKPPFVADASGDFFKALKGVSSEMGLSEDLTAAANCTEANVFSRLGIECVVFGPGGLSHRAHASQEHVNEQDLVVAKEFYKRIIERLCR